MYIHTHTCTHVHCTVLYITSNIGHSSAGGLLAADDDNDATGGQYKGSWYHGVEPVGEEWLSLLHWNWWALYNQNKQLVRQVLVRQK